MIPGIPTVADNDLRFPPVSFDETAACRYVMMIIGEIFPDKTKQEIDEARHACLVKLKSPRTREQYIRCLLRELSGYNYS